MTRFYDELNYGDEIRGVICPECGGSLLWNNNKAFCYEHGTVKPEREEHKATKLSEEDQRWLDAHSHLLEPEIE